MRGRLQKTGYLPGLTAELLPLRPRALPGNSLRAQHREDWDGSHSHPSPLRNAFWGRVKRSPSRPSVLPAEWGWRRVSGSTEAQVQQAGGFTWKWTDGWRERPRQPKRLQLNLKSFLRERVREGGPALAGVSPLSGAVTGRAVCAGGSVVPLTYSPFHPSQVMTCVNLERKHLLWVLFKAIHDDESGEAAPMPSN